MAAAATVAAGPFVGSFIGLLADRWPRGEGVIGGRSRCDACATPLAARDLAPLVSFALQAGRARCCGAPLRPFLPLVELAAAGLALWAVLAAPPTLAPATAALGWALLALALIDGRSMTLPDALTLPLLAAGLALSAAGATGSFAAHLGAAALGYGMVAAIGVAWRRLRGVEAIGMGDAKLLAAAGAWTGPDGLGSTLLWACLATLGWIAARGFGEGAPRWREPAPLGPGLALGLWLTWLHGPVALAGF